MDLASSYLAYLNEHPPADELAALRWGFKPTRRHRPLDGAERAQLRAVAGRPADVSTLPAAVQQFIANARNGQVKVH